MSEIVCTDHGFSDEIRKRVAHW